MAAQTEPKSIADLPAQHAGKPETQAEARARFFNSGNAFNIKLPPVPNAVFADQPMRALEPSTSTGFIACDASSEMECPFPATSPLLLARYARIRAGESLSDEARASGIIHYVIEGAGTTSAAGEEVAWQAGDVFVVPGGGPIAHSAADAAAVLWIVSNEPQIRFESLQSPAQGEAPTGVVHYRADEIDRQIELLYRIGQDEETAGTALVFSSDKQQDSRNVLPSLTLAMNSLPAGGMQRPHRHNSVAVSLVIQGKRCYSKIDGERKEWVPWATTITPPVSVHSHHNDGDELAMFLIVQDGGLYYHTRAMGFEFVDD